MLMMGAALVMMTSAAMTSTALADDDDAKGAQKLAVQGGILLAMSAGAFVAIRRVPPGDRGTLVRVPDQVRVVLALAVDLGLVASMLSGVVAVVRRLVGAGVIAGWADALVVATGIGIFYLIITRRSTGATAGEALLRTTYIARHQRAAAPAGSGASGTAEAEPDLLHAATLLRLVADVDRLRLLRVLLRSDCTSAELARETGLSVADTVYHLGQLWRAQLVVPVESGRGDVRYTVPSGSPREAVLALPVDYRTAVVLRDVNQLSYEEIAEALTIIKDDFNYVPLHQQMVVWATRSNVDLAQLGTNDFQLRYVRLK